VVVVLLAPLSAVVALIVKVSSRGPVIFRQERLGKDRRAFTVYKFRTMRHAPKDGGRHVWARDDDPRCTAVGRVLRAAGLDELPQLINVLRGEMSLVGPRPEMSRIARRLAKRIPEYAERVAVKPGMTGLAQIRGFRGNTSLHERLKYDLEYISRWSLRLDATILLATLFVCLRKCVEEASTLFRKQSNQVVCRRRQ